MTYCSKTLLPQELAISALNLVDSTLVHGLPDRRSIRVGQEFTSICEICYCWMSAAFVDDNDAPLFRRELSSLRIQSVNSWPVIHAFEHTIVFLRQFFSRFGGGEKVKPPPPASANAKYYEVVLGFQILLFRPFLVNNFLPHS